MTASDTSTELRFEPPGPGSWEQDPVHFPRPLTRYFQETHPPAFKRGTNDFARFYGMLIDGLQIGYVNGFGYNQVVPAPEAEIPERIQRAEQVFAQKLWREQLRDWDENRKPSAIATHRELQAVDPDALSDAELVAYLTRCRDHHSAMIAQHMRFTAGAVLPTGDFLAHVGDWTGLPPSELLGLMRGSAEVSAGGSDEMERLKKAFAQDPAARELLASDGDPAQVLAQPACPSGAKPARRSPATSTWSATASSTASTSPSPRRSNCRTHSSGPSASPSPEKPRPPRTSTPASPRSAPRSPRRTRPSSTSCSARPASPTASATSAASTATSGPRASCGAPPSRPAGGSRVAAASPRPQQMLDASLDEMCALVAGTGGPSADELARRAEYRATYTAKDVPPFLGPPAAAAA